MRVVVLSLFLVACANPSPREYRQSAMPMSPSVRAPAFNPAQDAPHSFARPERPALQPQPRPVRVLPETSETRKEATVWASSGSIPSGAPPTVLDVALSLDPRVLEVRPLNTVDDCADAINGVFGVDYALIASAARLAPLERKCLAATLFYECSRRSARGQADWFKKESTTVTKLTDARAAKNIRKQENVAFALYREWCGKKGADTTRMRSVAQDFTASIIDRARAK